MMYQRIMLTLDRSHLAERAIPHAIALAKAFNARLDLVSVVPLATVTGGPDFAVYVDWESEAAAQQEYLDGLVTQLRAEGLQASATLRRGDTAEEILHHAAEGAVDLIVMSTHGRSGLGRWVYGSIADRVLRHASVPVLLVRATEE